MIPVGVQDFLTLPMRVCFPDGDELVRVAVGKWFQKDRVHDAEYCRRCADPQSQRQDRYDRK